MTPHPTPWQLAAEWARSCMDDARWELDAEAWPFFIELLLAIVTREAQRLVIAEALRALREDDA